LVSRVRIHHAIDTARTQHPHDVLENSRPSPSEQVSNGNVAGFGPRMRQQRLRSVTRRLTGAGGLFLGYVCAAKLGLLFASVQPNATAIWPPTGIAIGACVLLGADAWLVIFAGAFLVNLTTAGSIATSLGIAVGNMLEGVLGAYAIEHWADGRRAFMRASNVFRFTALGGLLSPAVSATIGVTSLSLGGYAAWSLYGPIWLTWWLGDVAGALLVAPLILAWSAENRDIWRRKQWLEATSLLVALTGYGQPQTRHRAREAGFDLHLIKPVNAAQLHELLRSSQRN
jgi:integral membrane sensor domain MASE1